VSLGEITGWNKTKILITRRTSLFSDSNSTNNKGQRAGTLSLYTRPNHETLERFDLVRAGEGELSNKGNSQRLDYIISPGKRAEGLTDFDFSKGKSFPDALSGPVRDVVIFLVVRSGGSIPLAECKEFGAGIPALPALGMK
jgi:hypothetical protein